MQVTLAALADLEQPLFTAAGGEPRRYYRPKWRSQHPGAFWVGGEHRRGAATRAQVPALLKGLIFGPNGRPMSPSHTRRRGRIYRYYVTRDGGRVRHLRGDERACDGRRRRGAGPRPEAAGRA